ncbi:hypothetical protein Hypma_001872 [Hypsizygus marmoreus]|uniref:Uncharacterized protein n=1 Tax=Hypsizygus marmoreus TaxID=39966 RepID=A0A369JBY6_HYPMA|nr:hypothetical protein Hypma_001872 [Hypsizygus marmoreus]
MRQPSCSMKVEPSADISLGTPSPPATLKLETMKLAGDRPDFTVRPLARFTDIENEEVWLYWHDFDKKQHQMSKCNLKTKRWTNVTKRFSFVKFPWSPITTETKISLPVNFSGAVAGGTLAGHRVLLEFGGEVEHTNNSIEQTAAPRLTIFDLDMLKWWRVEIPTTGLSPRLYPFMVLIENSLYIFGGWTGYEGESKTCLIESYSIATFAPKTHRWSWSVQDIPYPDGTPIIGYAGDAISIQDGKKILLIPGIVKPNTLIDITPDRLVVFDIALRTFGTLHTTDVQFPNGLTGYDISSLSPSTNVNTTTAADDDSTSSTSVILASWTSFFFFFFFNSNFISVVANHMAENVHKG